CSQKYAIPVEFTALFRNSIRSIAEGYGFPVRVLWPNAKLMTISPEFGLPLKSYRCMLPELFWTPRMLVASTPAVPFIVNPSPANIVEAECTGIHCAY